MYKLVPVDNWLGIGIAVAVIGFVVWIASKVINAVQTFFSSLRPEVLHHLSIAWIVIQVILALAYIAFVVIMFMISDDAGMYTLSALLLVPICCYMEN